jgi:transcription-repair coupling factor (superfamily II helicase)
LEIRGAGEILGVSQSGTMHTVGVSHYLRMLKNAVEEMKAGRHDDVEIEENVEILLNIEALIPSFYVPDAEERITVYQKLAGSEDETILAEFESDLREEYGEAPKAVHNLFKILRLKLACRRSGVLRVKSEETRTGPTSVRRDVVLTLSPRVTAEHLMPLLKENPQWRISGNTLRIAEDELVKAAGSEEWIIELTREAALLRKPTKKAAKKE